MIKRDPLSTSDCNALTIAQQWKRVFQLTRSSTSIIMELPQMMNSIYHYHPTNQRRIHSSLPLFFYPRSSSPFSSPPSDMMNVFVAVTIKEYSAANLMKNTSRSWLFRRLCSSRLRYKYHYHSNYDSSFVLPSLSPGVNMYLTLPLAPRPKDSYDAIRTAPNEFILWHLPFLMNDYVFQLHPFNI